VTGTEQTEPIK